MTEEITADVVALRCYVPVKPKKNDKNSETMEAYQVDDRPCHSSSRVLVFDTETTVDKYQNLQFGSCGVWTNGVRESFYIFYNETLPGKDIATLKAVAMEHGYTLLTCVEFVESVFFPLVYEEAAYMHRV